MKGRGNMPTSDVVMSMDQKVVGNNREMRIAARRARIANRLLLASQSAQNAARTKTHSGEEDDAEGPANAQLASSLQNLSSIKGTLSNEVHLLRASIDDCEGQHRYAESQRLQELLRGVEEVKITCKEENVNLAEKWDQICSIAVPQQLAEQILEQRKACKKVLESKTFLLEKIEETLKLKTEEYGRAIHKQSTDIDALVIGMGHQVVNLYEAYNKEFHDIENSFLIQRQRWLSSNKVEIEALVKKMRSFESTFKERLYERLDEYNTALDSVRVQDSEDYNLLKMKLETDIQNLEQHLESMQAVYQLNGEKLDYNHRILIERDNDNYVTAGQQKRRLTKQRDILCNLKARHAELEKSFKTQNAKLAEDYARFTRLLQDLQSKEQDLRAGHELQQQKFFRMHQHSLAVLVSKVLQADKIIHEQQLGWRWRPPSNKFFIDLASAKPDESMDSLDSHMETEQLSSSSGEKVSEMVRLVQQPVLKAFAYETSFIISDEVKNAVAGLDPNLADHLRTLAALQTLGVTSPDAFIKLHEYLLFYSNDRRAKDHVVSQLQSYLMQSKDNTANALAFPPEQLQVALPTNLINASKVNPLRFSQEQKYWIDFTKAIDPKVFHVWGTLDISLKKYNQILKERMNIAKELDSLRSQNNELRAMLKLCLSSKAHEELQVPSRLILNQSQVSFQE
ncbi:hypothetical protein O6H91_17G053400 [Diphasiastrum complanatum]|uniref:Uncharacterized protein n=1 Tax=Diphasiastrum complanatum TaxID=34168 RepID=A0ACC2B706_DIPCM|nr:hypothetical protein O6H91_17G053400 [Diphasiastrum complanatum]